MPPYFGSFVDTSGTCTADRLAGEQIVAQGYYRAAVPCQEWFQPSLEQGIDSHRE